MCKEQLYSSYRNVRGTMAEVNAPTPISPERKAIRHDDQSPSTRPFTAPEIPSTLPVVAYLVTTATPKASPAKPHSTGVNIGSMPRALSVVRRGRDRGRDRGGERVREGERERGREGERERDG